MYVCAIAHAYGCGVRMRAPLEESSKGLIIDRQINCALYFRRQISGLTLMAHRGDRGMSGERRLHQVEADDTFSK